MLEKYMESSEAIKKSKSTIVFTGAGISIASGIPTFRGKDGLWEKYDPKFAEISYFLSHPLESWETLKKVFYDMLMDAKPNNAHIALAEMENKNYTHAIITQNIDTLHEDAGSKIVFKLHGSSKTLKCVKCQNKVNVSQEILNTLPPSCNKCGGLLKPDFVFFGEQLPEYDLNKSFDYAKKCNVCIIVGTTGEVMPASSIPHIAKQNGATIIEINPNPSSYTNTITDIYINEPSDVALMRILELLNK